MSMKLGKAKLKRILSEGTRIPVRDITICGRYDNYGNKERLTIGGHTITAMNGRVQICEPVFRGETVTYRTREIKGAPINEAATSGRTEK